MERYRNPWLELKVLYGANKGKQYTEEEDRFLVCMMHKLGYGAWDELKAEARRPPLLEGRAADSAQTPLF